MDDFLKRLGNVEESVADLRVQVGAIAATMPHLATAKSVAAIEAAMPHLATKADLSSMESKLIMWMVSTTLAAVAAAFSLAKFVH